MKLRLGLCLLALAVCAGCKKEPEGPAAREVKPLEALRSQEGAAPPPPDPTAAPPAELPAAPVESAPITELAEAAETLNSALSEYLDNGNPMISSLDDFVRLKIVRAMPKPPPGKKFVLDTAKRKVKIVNQ